MTTKPNTNLKIVAIAASVAAGLWITGTISPQGVSLPFATGQQEQQPMVLDFSMFKEKDIIKALHERDMEYLTKNERYVLAYIEAVGSTLPQLAVFTQDAGLMQMIDDTIAPSAARKMATSATSHQQVIENLGTLGTNMIEQYKKMSEPGYFENKSLGEMSADTTKMILPDNMVTIEQIQSAGTTDARRLIILYQQSPADFQQIYSTMAEFAQPN